MADLEAVLADVSYLMAMEKSKMTPAARASKKIILPDARYVKSACYFVVMPRDYPLDFNRTAFTDFVPACVMF